jgi:hypothetical protein
MQAHRGLMRAKRHTSSACLDQGRRQPFRAFAGAHHDAVKVADMAIADEHLAAVDDVVVAVPHGGGRHAENVAA